MILLIIFVKALNWNKLKLLIKQNHGHNFYFEIHFGYGIHPKQKMNKIITNIFSIYLYYKN